MYPQSQKERMKIVFFLSDFVPYYWCTSVEHYRSV